MTTGVPALPLDVDPLIAEAKQRARRRRLVALGLIVVAAAAAIAVTLSMRSTPRTAALSPLALAARDRVQIFDVGTSGGVTWAISDRRLWLTTNGGHSWIASRLGDLPPVYATFGDIKFFDRRHGWFQISGVIYRTSDGGRTWTHPGPAEGNSLDLSFVTPELGFQAVVVPGSSGPPRLLVTHDGGATWSASRTLPRGAENVQFVSARRGFTFAKSVVYSTGDGGRHWAPLFRTPAGCPNAYPQIGPVAAFGDKLVVPRHVPPCTGDPVEQAQRLSFYVSNDGGATWSIRRAPHPISGLTKTPVSPSLSVVSASTWVAATKSRIMTTTSAGRAWRMITPVDLPRGWIIAVAAPFISQREGWAVFESPHAFVLMRTTDGGRHWTPAGPLKPKGHA